MSEKPKLKLAKKPVPRPLAVTQPMDAAGKTIPTKLPVPTMNLNYAEVHVLHGMVSLTLEQMRDTQPANAEERTVKQNSLILLCGLQHKLCAMGDAMQQVEIMQRPVQTRVQ